MIAEYREPKLLPKDAIPIEARKKDEAWSKAALNGSARLRDAILIAKGHPTPAKPKKPRKQRAQVPMIAPHAPACCEACGAPLKPAKMMVSHIQAEVAAYYRLHPSSMTSQRRSFDISHPRQVAMFLSAELTPKSLPDIGRRFGGRDHTTVLYAVRQVGARIENDPEIAADVMILRERLAA